MNAEAVFERLLSQGGAWVLVVLLCVALVRMFNMLTERDELRIKEALAAQDTVRDFTEALRALREEFFYTRTRQ